MFRPNRSTILGAKAIDVRLKPGDMMEEGAAKMLMPAPMTLLVDFEKSTVVNLPNSDKPMCIETVA